VNSGQSAEGFVSWVATMTYRVIGGGLRVVAVVERPAAVSSGALVVAHENSGTLTRVGPDGERVTREVGPRPYGVSANDDRVVVGLQGERAVAEFDSSGLTERRRVPLGPSGPDS